MKKNNSIQKALIKKAELAHANGLRHPGLSGTICEDLLIKSLIKSLPGIRMSRGIIKFGDLNIIGSNLHKDNLSTQFDIIIYKNKPIYREGGNVVVASSNICAVIEVKKWVTLQMFGELRDSINKIKGNFKIKTGREIPFILVAFRCHDRGQGIKWWNDHSAKLSAKCAVCFSGNYSHKNGRNLYPYEEVWWTNFDEYSYNGQYDELVKQIKMML